MILLVLGLVLFIGLVLVHEWGHFIVARRNGVEVEEFGLFFPPRAKVLTKRNGTEYTLNWLPLGGFVKLKGENDSDRRPGTFGAATTWVKTKIMLAGVAMNVIAAYLILLVLSLTSMPQVVPNQFTVARDTHIVKQQVLTSYIEPDSPAAAAGFQNGDVLQAIGLAESDQQIITTADTLPDLTKSFAGQTVYVRIERAGGVQNLRVQLRDAETVTASQQTDNPVGYLGIAPTEYTTVRNTWSAPVVAGGLLVQFTDLTLQGLGKALVGLGGIVAGAVTGNDEARQTAQTEASNQVSGPVGIFFVLKEGGILGVSFILFVIAIISLSLAIMNALPIPALDGGRLFVMLVSRLFKKPLSQKAEEAIHGTGFMVLIGLIILITVVDVQRFF